MIKLLMWDRNKEVGNMKALRTGIKACKLCHASSLEHGVIV